MCRSVEKDTKGRQRMRKIQNILKSIKMKEMGEKSYSVLRIAPYFYFHASLVLT